jgi:prephenate dehydratase
MSKISIQGFKGSFHDTVAANVFEDRALLERSTFREVFADVVEGRADFGIAAIENSIAGAILENYNLLRDSGLQVIGEYYLRIVHNLMALPGTKLSDVKEVWSHPMALKQCQKFLQENLPGVKQVETDDTARSATQVREGNLEGVAAIASKLAAEIFDLEILAPGIEDDPQNFTRFLIVAKDARTPLQKNQTSLKTSIYVETAHKPGGLLPVLQVLKDMNANMTMLVSRPVVGKAWEYGFYIDFVSEDGVEHIVEKLNSVCDKVQVLGTYSDLSKSEARN